MADTMDDRTMQLPSGSLVFLVKGVLFRIPVALAEKNSSIASMTSSVSGSDSEQEPREIDVSLQAFRDWLDVLYTPLDSCLIPSHPALNDLGRLLELLLFCRTYKATDLEAYVLPFVGALTRPETFVNNLTNGLTVYCVGELASALNEDDIVATARSVILACLWPEQLRLPDRRQPPVPYAELLPDYDEPISELSPPLDPTVPPAPTIGLASQLRDPYEALLYGERVNDKEIIGAAYYQLMLASVSPWALDKRLTAHQCLNLQRGMIACAEDWRRTFDAWGKGAHAPSSTSEVKKRFTSSIIQTRKYWLHGAWGALADRSLSLYDVLGKAVEVIRYATALGCPTDKIITMEEDFNRIKSNLHIQFTSHDAPSSSITSAQGHTACLPVVDAVYDATMLLPSGSLVFLVEGVLFRIPKALLKSNSEGFANMIRDSMSNEEPIELDDSLEIFREWTEVVLTPITLYANPAHPLHTNLEKVLRLLLFCQKYVITKLEEYLVPIAERLTTYNCLRANLTASLTTFTLVEIAEILHLPLLSTAARAFILEDIWSRRAIDPYETLAFGERTGTKAIIGAAYYRLLFSEWSLESRLSMQQRQHLEFGKNACADAWQEMFDSWCMEPDNGTDDTLPGIYWLHGVCKSLVRGRFKAYDVIGRLGAAIQFASTYCSYDRNAVLQAQMDNVKTNIYTYFVPEILTAGGPDIGDNVQDQEQASRHPCCISSTALNVMNFQIHIQ